MVSDAQNNQLEEDASFAELFAAQESEQKYTPPLEAGQKVKVKIVAIDTETVFVSTGVKVDGIVERAELEVDGELPHAIGDELELYVTSVSAHEIRLSKAVRGAHGIVALEEAKAAKLPVEGKVKAVIKGGYRVEIMHLNAFCPASQISLQPASDAESFVGQTFPFIITKLEKNARNIVVSRRSLLEADYKEKIAALLAGIKEGDVLEGKITRLAPFGAFVELDENIEGLVHISELSWSKSVQSDEVLSLGDAVRVKFLGHSTDAKGNDRIGLSIRQITEDPWNNVAERLHNGDLVSGKVTKLSSFGAFIEILPGIEGMVHLSEMSWGKRVHKAEEIIQAGEEVTVKIKEVDVEKRRISLSLRDAQGDPWANVATDFPVASEQKGTLESRSNFGLFISLGYGITGLMPNAFISRSSKRNQLDKLAVGEEVLLTIHDFDQNARKITLAPLLEEGESLDFAPANNGPAPKRDFKSRPASAKGGRAGKPREDDSWKKHTPPPSGSAGFSILGDALALAIKDKK